MVRYSERLVQAPDQFVCEMAHQVRPFDAGGNKGKFVAPETGQSAGFTANRKHTLSHLFDQLIAREVAQRIVHQLELIEIDKENRARFGGSALSYSFREPRSE